MSSENKLKELFLHDKPRKKWICQVKIGERICGTELADCGNVSGRTRHLAHKHPNIKLVKKNSTQSAQQTQSIERTEGTIVDKLNSVHPIGSARYKKLNAAVLEYIILSNLPLSHVDDPVFQKLLINFDSKHNQRCAKTITNVDLPEQYERAVEGVRRVLQSVDYLAYTSDCWSSQGNPFMSLTGHFVDRDFVFKSCLLGLKNVSDSHTSQCLADNMFELMKKWNTTDKSIAVTIDGAANGKLAVELIPGNLTQLYCVCHMINLVVKDVIENPNFLNGKLTDLMLRCRQLVGLFKRSDQLKHKLSEVMKEIYKEETPITKRFKSRPLKLKQDVPTRWNSGYLMLESILLCQDGIRMVITSDPKTFKDHCSKLLSSQELEIVRGMCELLQPFYEFTRLMSGQQYVTVSVVLPALSLLQDMLHCYDLPKVLEPIGYELSESLETRSRQYYNNRLVLAATFLDPRHRKFKFIKDQNERDRLSHTARQYIKTKCHEIANKGKRKANDQPSKESSAKRIRREGSSYPTQLTYPDSDNEESNEPEDIVLNEIIGEITRFYNTHLKLSDELNPLEFYKEHQHVYPHLANLARMLFAIPASSVPSECLFSKAADITTNDRNRLKPDKVETLMFIKENARYITF